MIDRQTLRPSLWLAEPKIGRRPTLQAVLQFSLRIYREPRLLQLGKMLSANEKKWEFSELEVVSPKFSAIQGSHAMSYRQLARELERWCQTIRDGLIAVLANESSHASATTP